MARKKSKTSKKHREAYEKALLEYFHARNAYWNDKNPKTRRMWQGSVEKMLRAYSTGIDKMQWTPQLGNKKTGAPSKFSNSGSTCMAQCTQKLIHDCYGGFFGCAFERYFHDAEALDLRGNKPSDDGYRTCTPE
jgi:hypothetical protein